MTIKVISSEKNYSPLSDKAYQCIFINTLSICKCWCCTNFTRWNIEWKLLFLNQEMNELNFKSVCTALTQFNFSDIFMKVFSSIEFFVRQINYKDIIALWIKCWQFILLCMWIFFVTGGARVFLWIIQRWYAAGWKKKKFEKMKEQSCLKNLSVHT